MKDHLRGCALSPDERDSCDEGRVVELQSSSPISMMASPDKVASVPVGDVGD
jgi:hypothetical protein